MRKADKKKQKEKIVYVDDGSTIADMSGVGAGRRQRGDRAYSDRGYSSTWKDKVKTYFSAVRMMIIPMLVVLGIVTVFFLIMMLIALAVRA